MCTTGDTQKLSNESVNKDNFKTVSRFSPSSQLLKFIYLRMALNVGVKWYLIVILICVSLMTNDVEHLLMCVLVIHLPLLKYLFISFFDLHWVVFL